MGSPVQTVGETLVKGLEEGPELFLVRNTRAARARQGRRRKDGCLELPGSRGREAARDPESDFWSEVKAVVQRREPVRRAWLQDQRERGHPESLACAAQPLEKFGA